MIVRACCVSTVHAQVETAFFRSDGSLGGGPAGRRGKMSRHRHENGE